VVTISTRHCGKPVGPPPPSRSRVVRNGPKLCLNLLPLDVWKSNVALTENFAPNNQTPTLANREATSTARSILGRFRFKRGARHNCKIRMGITVGSSYSRCVADTDVGKGRQRVSHLLASAGRCGRTSN
jgi:hypothetical protein